MVILLATTVATACMDAPVGGRSTALAGAICSVALDAACLAVGESFITRVAAISNVVALHNVIHCNDDILCVFLKASRCACIYMHT